MGNKLERSMSNEHRTYNKVFLNVYDLHSSNTITGVIGIGAYHTGVEYRNREYCFSEAGVTYGGPRMVAAPAVFKESIVMGETTKGPGDVAVILNRLRKRFPGSSYNIVTNNCNVFSEAFCKELLQDCDSSRSFPKWINRLARTGSLFSKGPRDNGGSKNGKEEVVKEKKLSTKRGTLSDTQKAMLAKMKLKKAERVAQKNAKKT
eukprot:g4394.t1